ncbi:MAG: transglutaminase domain-containing protein [Ferruginibacter sp.]|nr:transglutaminase domain-containing protein [Ferruginibacter sp.]
MYKTKLIKPPRMGDDKIAYPNGSTKDIISTVLYGDKKAAYYTAEFAKTLEAPNMKQTCRNIWAFVKTQIPYVLDENGKQWIKSPGRLWKEKAGDCKSFSVFTASCLRNLGITYGYRFASYRPDPTPTHVYVFVPLANGTEIILDSVWDGPFNTQKEFTYKQDHLTLRHYSLPSGEVRRGLAGIGAINNYTRSPIL